MSRELSKKVLMENIVGEAIPLPARDRVRCIVCQSFYWKIYAEYITCSFCKSIFVIIDKKLHAFGDQNWWGSATKGRSGNIVDKKHVSADWVIYPDLVKNQRNEVSYELLHPMNKMFFTPVHRNLGAAR